MPKKSVVKTYVDVDGKQVPATVYREYRRNIRFYIGKKGAILRLPVIMPADLQQKEWVRFTDWVKKKVTAYNGEGDHAFGKAYRDGDEVTVGTRTYRLKISDTINKTHSGKIEGGNIIHLRLSQNAHEEQRKKAARHLLSRLVAQDFHPEIHRRVMELNHLYFQKNINGVNLKFNRSNWGSCSAKGNINLSTCLLFAPNDVIDYVIIHELAHLVEMNHSIRFWALVENAMPDYKEKKKWLKDNWQMCNF